MINMQPNLIHIKSIKGRGNKKNAREIKMHEKRNLEKKCKRSAVLFTTESLLI